MKLALSLVKKVKNGAPRKAAAAMARRLAPIGHRASRARRLGHTHRNPLQAAAPRVSGREARALATPNARDSQALLNKSAPCAPRVPDRETLVPVSGIARAFLLSQVLTYKPLSLLINHG